MKFEYTTDRLILKVLTPDYAEQTLAFQLDGKECFEPIESAKPDNFYTAQFQEMTLQGELNAFMSSQYMRYYIFAKNNPSKIIGTVSFAHIMRGAYDSAIIGYKFLPAFHKQGYATEALSCLITQVFEDFGLHRLIAYTLPDNYDSIGLLARLGFEFECLSRSAIKLQGQFVDHNRYVRINPLD